MRWSYKTVHYELKKEGLLGSTFIDESEVEQSLNEYGKAGWELVSMLETLDGLIAVFKQPLGEVTEELILDTSKAAPARGANDEFEDSLVFRGPEPEASPELQPHRMDAEEEVSFDPLDEVFEPKKQQLKGRGQEPEDDVGSIRIE